MSRPAVSRLMNADEFSYLAKAIAGNVDHWLDRVHDLTAIDKPTLTKYASGERAVPNTHALFIRQIYLLQKASPDLASDLMVLTRKPTHEGNSLPAYEGVVQKAILTAEVKRLRSVLKRINEMSKPLEPGD